MRVFLDQTKCSGYGACADNCPSVFAIDEFGFSELLNTGEVPSGDEDAAHKAITGCPEQAISEGG